MCFCQWRIVQPRNLHIEEGPGPLFLLGTLSRCLGGKRFGGTKNEVQKKEKKFKLQRTNQSLANYSVCMCVELRKTSTIENEKINSLMLLCTQNDIIMLIDYNDVIDDFKMIKSLKNVHYKYNDRWMVGDAIRREMSKSGQTMPLCFPYAAG
ncbi:hypothetical protein TNCV_2797541 [Trichonephila clavipes]|nr:hypothetical protein TNCV_2797541 [Trichonephila clavipes]